MYSDYNNVFDVRIYRLSMDEEKNRQNAKLIFYLSIFLLLWKSGGGFADYLSKVVTYKTRSYKSGRALFYHSIIARNMSTEAELGALTVPRLKERLTALNLPTAGKKADLVARLLEVCVPTRIYWFTRRRRGNQPMRRRLLQVSVVDEAVLL